MKRDANIVPRTRRDLHAEMWPIAGWFALVPPDVAIRQLAWERRHRIVIARNGGATLREIADRIGRSPERVRWIEAEGRRWRISPVSRWLADQSYVRDVAKGRKHAGYWGMAEGYHTHRPGSMRLPASRLRY